MAFLTLDGEGDLETMPDAMPGFPIDLSTVSNVRSIFLRDLVKSSCFLVLKLSVHMVERLTRRERTWMYACHDWILRKCIRDSQHYNVCMAVPARRLHISF